MSETKLDSIFSALSDPTRRAILTRLATGETTVNDLAKPFDISQPAISRHLKVLERAGLITRGKEAQYRPCKLDTENIRIAFDWLEFYRRQWEESFDRLDKLLAEEACMSQSSTNPDTSIVIEHTFDAPISAVFDAFTDPAKLVKWWGPQTYHTRDWTIDPQVGGSFRYVMAANDGSDEHWCRGVFSDVTPNKRLTSTAIIENPAGPDEPNIAETMIDIQFFDENGKTRVVATQSGLPDASWSAGATQGWSEQFEKLDDFLATD